MLRQLCDELNISLSLYLRQRCENVRRVWYVTHRRSVFAESRSLLLYPLLISCASVWSLLIGDHESRAFRISTTD